MTITRDQMIDKLTAAEEKTAKRILHEANRLQDEYFRRAKSAEESKQFRKVSRFLATMWELTSLLVKTPPGQSIVIDADTGNVYRGRVKFDKLTLLAEKLPGRQNHAVDTEGRGIETFTSPWTSVPSQQFKTSWDKAMRPHLYKEEYVEPIYELFQTELEEVLANDPTGSTLSYHIHVDPQGLSYNEITIKGFPISVAAIESGKFVYYRKHGGEPIWV